MGKKKSTQTTEHKYYTPPATQDTTALRDLAENVDFTTPIVDAYGRAEGNIDHQIFEDDLGEGVKERVKNAQMFNLAQNKGAALSAAKGQEHIAKTGTTATLAGMTNPQLAAHKQTMVQPVDWTGMVSSGAMGAGLA